MDQTLHRHADRQTDKWENNRHTDMAATRCKDREEPATSLSTRQTSTQAGRLTDRLATRQTDRWVNKKDEADLLLYSAVSAGLAAPQFLGIHCSLRSPSHPVPSSLMTSLAASAPGNSGSVLHLRC